MNGLVPLALLATSLVTAAAIFPMAEEARRARTIVNLIGAVLKLAIVLAVAGPVLDGQRFEWSSPLLPGVGLLLRIDELSLLFMTLSALLWLLTTIYAIGFLEHSPHRSRFFGFFSLCVTSTVGISLAGNMVTFLVFYELLTLATYPLVAHKGTPEALAGARVYLRYTIGGGAVLLIGVVWLTVVTGPVAFTPGGAAEVVALATDQPGVMAAIFTVLIAGLAVKSALVPVHGWLPQAMVAPAPVSALLHAVAVVKAGVFGIVRVVYDVFGIPTAAGLGVLTPLAVVAAVTIVFGSLRALAQDDLKKRLAYSTVSQISYIVLGSAVVGVVSTTGALAHLVHQGLMKITLFFCAGAIAQTLHLHKVSDLSGVGRRMPVTMAAFTIGALGMIGVPPIAGFVTKLYLGVGAVQSGHVWVVAVLAVSTVLNAAYFLPILIAAWFGEWIPTEGQRSPRPHIEANVLLVGPAAITAGLSLAVGVFAAFELSPLGLATRIAERGYP
jgi:multicomponent Na+:H+ antiporter subunit D